MTKNSKIPDYITFTRDLKDYKWYKPILTIILSVIFYLILMIVVLLLIEGPNGLNNPALTNFQYESMNATSIKGLSDFLYVILMIPSVFLASIITRDRSFSTYLTSRKKWNWEIFLKSFIISSIIMIIFNIIPELIIGAKINITFTIVTFILAIILVPLQCFAEELTFRGLFMQTFGAWFKIPILAIILQTILFTILHPYNIIGQITVAVSGIAYGVLAWKMNGIEASSGIHSANNLLLMLSMGILSVAPIPTDVTIFGALMDSVMTVLNVGVLLYLSRKTNWLNAE